LVAVFFNLVSLAIEGELWTAAHVALWLGPERAD
jgi:hypothetical protein